MKNLLLVPACILLLNSATLPAFADPVAVKAVPAKPVVAVKKADSPLKKAGMLCVKAVALPVLVVVGAGCGFVVGGVGGAMFWHEFGKQEANMRDQKANTEALGAKIKAIAEAGKKNQTQETKEEPKK